MEVICSVPTRSSSSSSSTLNPNAPSFVPMAFRTVEDFSDQWWDLVHSSPWFRDYWLRERFQDPQTFDDLDQDDFFPDFLQFQLLPRNVLEEDDEEEEEEEEGGDYQRELVPMGALKWRSGSGWAELPRYAQKAPKIVKARVSPRMIHQPR